MSYILKIDGINQDMQGVQIGLFLEYINIGFLITNMTLDSVFLD